MAGVDMLDGYESGHIRLVERDWFNDCGEPYKSVLEQIKKKRHGLDSVGAGLIEIKPGYYTATLCNANLNTDERRSHITQFTEHSTSNIGKTVSMQ